MREENKAPNFNLSQFGRVLVFVVLEVLALFASFIWNSIYLYTIVSILLVALVIAVMFQQVKKDGLSNIGFFLFPILVYGFLSAISYLYLDPNFALSNSWFRFIVPFGLVGFAAVGYYIASNQNFKIGHALLAIYSGIAFLTFLNLIVTMVQFVPFYTIRYANYYLYYDGSPSPVPISEMAYFLTNFSFEEVSLSYFTFYPMILLTAFLPLSFISYSKQKKTFVAYLSFGILGLLTIILTINKFTLLYLFVIAVVIALINIFTKFNLRTKWLKLTMKIIGGLAIAGFVLLLLNAQDSVSTFRLSFLRDLTTKNALFDRLFNSNRLVSGYNAILDGTFTSVKILGYPIAGAYQNFGMMTWVFNDSSNSFFFDSFFVSGLFGTGFLVFILIMCIRHVFFYYMYSTDKKEDKVLILGFILVSLIYSFIAFDATPYVFYNSIVPFYMNNIFFIIIFLFGYCLFKSLNSNRPIVVKKTIKEEKEETPLIVTTTEEKKEEKKNEESK